MMNERIKPRLFYGYVIVLAGFIILFALWGSYYSFGIFFKPLLNEFGWTRAMTSGAFSFATMMRGFMGIVMGKLTDRFGPRLVMAGCGLFLGAGYLLMSQIEESWQLYLFYGVLVGTGMGGCWVPVLSTVARWFVKNRGMMTGITLTGMSIGLLVISPVARWLVANYGWQASYSIMGVFAFVFIVVAALFLRREPGEKDSLNDGGTNTELSAGQQTEGLSFMEAIYTKQLWIVFTMLFCYGFVIATVMVHLVPYVTDLGISAARAANMLAIIGGISIFTKLIIGSTASRIGSKAGYIMVLIVASISMLWLTVAQEMWMLYLFVIIFGFAYAGDVLETLLVADLFGLRSLGVLMSIEGMGFTIGFAVGPFIAGYIFDQTGSYQMAFLTCAVVSVVGIVLMSMLKVIKTKGGVNESRRSA